MRKRKALLSVDGNLLSKPPMRRLESDGEFSMESWEERALADSKTPKTSNVGGSSSKPSKSKKMSHRRPPLPTRSKHGSFGSSILGASRRTPRKMQRGGISLRTSPRTESPNPRGRRHPQMTPKIQRDVILPHQAQEEPQTQHLDSLKIVQPQAATHERLTDRLLQRQGGQRAIDNNHTKAKTKGSSQAVSFALSKEQVSRAAVEDRAIDVELSDNRDSDEDMNCESSDEESLLNSSDSAPEIEKKWSTSREELKSPTKKHAVSLNKLVHIDVEGQNAIGNGASIINRNQHAKDASYIVSGKVEKQDRESSTLKDRLSMDAYTPSGLLGATVGNKNFSREDLEDDTDLTDMASLTSNDGESTDASFDSYSNDDDNNQGGG